MRRTSLTLFVLCTLLAGCKQAAGTAADDAAGDPQYVRAHSLQQLMDTVIEPDAEQFWRSSGTVSDSRGTRDLTPSTDEAWAQTRSAAATVAEMGNLLMTPLYSQNRGSDWIGFSQDLVHAGRQAERAASSRDANAMFVAGGKIADACSACHQAFLTQEQAAKADSPT